MMKEKTEELYNFVWDGEDTVDLGLPSGTIWQAFNLGGSKPEDFGLYYQWGDTKGYGGSCKKKESDSNDDKHYFDISKYKHCEGSLTTLTKYCTDAKYGTVDNKKVLDDEDDAAYVASGGEFRMPTEVQMQELLDNSTKYWTMCNGVKGVAFISINNGRGIFFPASGYGSTSDIGLVGSLVRCWTSSLDTSSSHYAYNLYLYSTSAYASNVSHNRYYGCPVRGVKV